jgi:hypothetical protein
MYSLKTERDLSLTVVSKPACRVRWTWEALSSYVDPTFTGWGVI